MSAPLIQPEPERDHYGRYKLPHPTGDTAKLVPWTRATTFAKSIADTYGLTKWQVRMAVKGLTMRPDLFALAASAPITDKTTLDKVAEACKEAAGTSAGANQGTALHSFTEQRDRGEPLVVPAPWDRDVKAYADTMTAAGLAVDPTLIERIIVIRDLGIAGTFDRILRRPDGTLIIGDLKGLALTTPIPTPDGWTTMGAVQVGAHVFDAYGRVCTVTAKSRTKRIGTYVVTFDDRSEIVCDREHIWWTASGFTPKAPEPVSITSIIKTLTTTQGQKHHRVPVADPLVLPEVDLPIDPYLLGCWLGDGETVGGSITKEEALFDILRADGHELGKRQPYPGKPHVVTYTVLGLRRKLRETGLFGHKTIPDAYLRASIKQRLRLLQGLMDTDGTWNIARQRAVFNSTLKSLAYQVAELVTTLGQRVHVAEYQATGFGKTVTAYAVEFTPVDIVPFRLARKRDQALVSFKPTTRSRRRLIVSVEPGPDVETACIAVDSASHTYLCGERMIPTHNTGKDLSYGWLEIAIQLALYAHGDAMWNGVTGKYEPMPVVNQDVGIVMHLPVGAAQCTMFSVDIAAGWEAAQLCRDVRGWRTRRNLAAALPVTKPTVSRLLDQIMYAATRADLERLWRANENIWNPDLTAAATARLAQL